MRRTIENKSASRQFLALPIKEKPNRTNSFTAALGRWTELIIKKKRKN